MTDAFAALADGFAIALSFRHLGFAFLGATLGTAVGILPGIGPAMTVALLLPVTFGLDPTSALILFAGIYYGAMYGGSTTSILLNTPGEGATIVTAIEGHQMARKGRGGAALATAAIGSFVAGTIATLLLALLGPRLAEVALRLGPPEYFALIVLAFVSVTTVLGESAMRGWASLFLGLTIGVIGIDAQTGEARFTFGVPQLLDGVDVVVIAVGLFAVGETLYNAWLGAQNGGEIVPVHGSLWMSREEWRRSWKPWLRGTAVGFPLGALPAGGAELPTFISYAIERRLTRRPEEFGDGAIEGVAGPEAANNASAAGTLVPLLSLGLPTTATAAVLLAAFQQYGLQPGPLLFQNEPGLVWSLVASLFVGNAMLLVLNLPLVGLWVKLLSIPVPLLSAGILVLATVGTYTLHHSVVDLIILFTLGWLGFGLRRFGFPVVPVVVGAMLGPLAEQHLLRSLGVGGGHWSIFVTRPGAAIMLLCALAIGIVVAVRRGAPKIST